MSRNLTGAILSLVVAASATSAIADERCSGTLCDMYYGTSSSFDDKPAPKPAAPTPIMVPKGGLLGMFGGGRQSAATGGAPTDQPAPQQRRTFGVGGGGLAGMARGEDAGQCSGTLCDLYYGKTSSFDDPPQEAAAPATPAPVPAAIAAEAAPAAPAEMQGFHNRPEPARCASTGRDPWSCYR